MQKKPGPSIKKNLANLFQVFSVSCFRHRQERSADSETGHVIVIHIWLLCIPTSKWVLCKLFPGGNVKTQKMGNFPGKRVFLM